MHQERTPTTVRQLLVQIQDLQNKVNSLSDAIEFHDSETGSSSGATHVSSQPLIIPSPRTMRSRDSGLPLDTRNSLGSSGNVFERLPARKRTTCFLRQIKEFGIIFLRIGIRQYCGTWERGETRSAEFFKTNSSFYSRSWKLEPCQSYCQCGVMDYPEIFVLGTASQKNSQTHWSFQAGKSTSRLKYVPQKHDATDHQSRESKTNRQSYDVAVDYKAKRFHRLRHT